MVGAISLWEVFPDTTQQISISIINIQKQMLILTYILQYAIKGMPYALVSYGPDGMLRHV